MALKILDAPVNGDREYGFKTCPRCGEQLFSDMDICYGCLYDFGRAALPSPDLLPDPLAQNGFLAAEPKDAVAPRAKHAASAADATGSLGADKQKTMALKQVGLRLRVSSRDMELCVPLPEEGLVIGRADGSDIQLLSRAVSRDHVRVSPLEGSAIVQNLGATNPAVVRGREVEDAVELQTGDTMDVCGTAFTLERDLKAG